MAITRNNVAGLCPKIYVIIFRNSYLCLRHQLVSESCRKSHQISWSIESWNMPFLPLLVNRTLWLNNCLFYGWADPNGHPFIKKVLIDPNLIYTLSQYPSFGSNYGAPLLVFQFNYGILFERYTHYRFKSIDNSFSLKSGIPVLLVPRFSPLG